MQRGQLTAAAGADQPRKLGEEHDRRLIRQATDLAGDTERQRVERDLGRRRERLEERDLGALPDDRVEDDDQADAPGVTRDALAEPARRGRRRRHDAGRPGRAPARPRQRGERERVDHHLDGQEAAHAGRVPGDQHHQHGLQRELAHAERRLPAEALQSGEERGGAAVEHEERNAGGGEQQRHSPPGAHPREQRGRGQQRGRAEAQCRLRAHQPHQQRAGRARPAAADRLGGVARDRGRHAEAQDDRQERGQPDQECVAAHVGGRQRARDDDRHQRGQGAPQEDARGHGDEIAADLSCPAPGRRHAGVAHGAPSCRRAARTRCCDSRGPRIGRRAAPRRSQGGTSPSRRRSTGCERLLISRETA